MEKCSIQIQSVLYLNQQSSLKRALYSIANAVRVNKSSDLKVGSITVCYGDASPKRLFDNQEVLSLKKEFSDLFEFKYEFFNENTGSAKGHNTLAKDCNSEYMLIMNPDVILCPKFFEKIIAPFVNDTSNTVGMTEARQTPVEHPKCYDRKTLETDWATTACALFKTEDFNAIDGFDYKTFFLYCDDLDFSWRIRLLGKKILYIPDCVVFHAKTLSVSGEWQPTNAEIYYSAEAGLLMAYKWSNKNRFRKLYDIFKNSGDENLNKAAAHFDELKRNKQLPKQLDKEHKVARFVGDYYTKHRFTL